MSDSFQRMEPRRGRARRAPSSRTLPAILLLLVCAVVAVVLHENFGGFGALYQAGPAQPFAAAPQASVAAAPPADEFRQLVKDLGASLQLVADKLEVTQRQLASEQGERALLSEQVGALSARVSALSASNASATVAAVPPSPKRKPIAIPR
jgi:hypothetical protein